jgi:alcohol dehydrogenase (cytochrome c)
VISYEIGGKQYVATTSGVVSGFFGGRGTSALVIFALPDSVQTVRTAAR